MDDNGAWLAGELCAYRPALRSYAAGLLGSAADADDLVQETLLRAWRYRATYRSDTSLKGWLFRILKNEFISTRSRPRPIEDVDGRLAAKMQAPEKGEWTVEVEDTLAALERLPPVSREALILVAEGKSYDEIATICGCAVGSVKSRVSRARRRLLDLLSQTSAPPLRHDPPARPQGPEAMGAA
jgi:RNA polymerase sigma-70 factor (ECF subfamily)